MFSAQNSKAQPWCNTLFPRHAVQGGEDEMAAFVDNLVRFTPDVYADMASLDYTSGFDK
jgi:Putative testis-expressed protein 13C, zinc finger domain